MRTFSGRSAIHTVSPGFASGAGRARNVPALALATVIAAGPASTHLAFDQVHVADEIRDPARIRLLVDFRRGRDLDEASAVHHADAVGDRHRLLLVVGDDDEREPEPFLEMHQLELRLLAQLLVERRQRLVEQQHARALDQRARERDALALAARQLVRLALGEALELDQRQHLRDPRRDLRLAAAPPA